MELLTTMEVAPEKHHIQLLDCGGHRVYRGARVNVRTAASPLPRRHQVVEALMCIFSKDVKSQKVKFTDHGQNTDTIDGDVPCRHSSLPDWATLVDNRCVPKDVVTDKART